VKNILPLTIIWVARQFRWRTVREMF